MGDRSWPRALPLTGPIRRPGHGKGAADCPESLLLVMIRWRGLAGRIGAFYRRQGLDPDGTQSTSFVAVVGPETAWPGAEARSEGDLRDGAANTLIVVETADAGIPWMKPEDLRFDRMSFRVNDG